MWTCVRFLHGSPCGYMSWGTLVPVNSSVGTSTYDFGVGVLLLCVLSILHFGNADCALFVWSVRAALACVPSCCQYF